MKRVSAVILVLCMALSLCACSSSGSGSASGEKVIKIGVFEPSSGDSASGGKKEILGMQYANSQEPTVTLGGETYKRPKAGAPSELLAPWFQMKTISITHEEKLTEELFSRDVVDRIKTGYTFLLPYYDYFLTLPSDPEPETLK